MAIAMLRARRPGPQEQNHRLFFKKGRSSFLKKRSKKLLLFWFRVA
jgi:hypothetical protein